MERKTTLSKNAYLWEVGNNARTIAILESGKLGVKVNDRLVGIISPKMVIGESAINGLDGELQKRTASVIAMEDDTQVTEYPADLVKRTFDAGKKTVTELILMTLIGQTCRNVLLVMSSHRDQPIFCTPLKGLMQGIVHSKAKIHDIPDWETFLSTFRFLGGIRDFSERLRKEHVVLTSDKAVLIEKASATIREMVTDTDLIPMLEGFIQAEQDKNNWLEREG